MGLIARLAHGRIHYAWIVAGAAFVTLLVASGVRAVPTVFIVPIETEFGWSRASLSFAVAVGLLIYGLLGPFSAAFMDRIGLRATLSAAFGITAIGLAGTLTMSASWQLTLLWGVVMGIGTGLAGPVLGAIVANRWFAARRGLVMGVLTSSMAAGQLVFLPVFAELVSAGGWRWSTIVLAAALVVIIPVIGIPMRDNPQDLGLKPFGGDESAEHPVIARRENPFMAAFSSLGIGLASRDFWLLSMSFFVCGASTNGLIGTHFVPFCIESGVVAETAAGLLAAMGIFNFIGTMGSGWLTDRFDSRYLLFWYYGLRGLSLLFLPYVFDFSFFGLALFGAFYGLDWIATVPPTVRLAGNSFGLGRAGMMFGWIMAMHQVGSAAAAAGAGILHDYFGSYTSSFMISGLLCFVASAVVLRIGKRAEPDRPLETAPAGA
jgi:MFS family permease